MLLSSAAFSVLPGYSSEAAPFSTGNNDPFASSTPFFSAPGWHGDGEQGRQNWNEGGVQSAEDLMLSYDGRLGIGFDGTRDTYGEADEAEAKAAAEAEAALTAGCPVLMMSGGTTCSGQNQCSHAWASSDGDSQLFALRWRIPSPKARASALGQPGLACGG